MSDLVILGASGHGREVASCLIASAGAHGLDPLGFLDDDAALTGTVIGGLRVLGTLDRLATEASAAVLGVGYPEVKHRVLERCGAHVTDWPSILHPSSQLGSRNVIGRGCLVQAGCVITVDVMLGEFVTVNVAATINHDCRIERLATISPGAHLGGNVTLREGAFIGIGASIIQGVTIGAWSVVGAGAVVLDDVAPNTVVAGGPARTINERKAGWHDDR